ncbi:MAG: toll/interleukin-1 receptor domain-containing protein [Gammaproteobacteria bacterium]|nr:toll/interleukin-1 receptor domain-containing protein [Gammaproteobacteria bacterium]
MIQHQATLVKAAKNRRRGLISAAEEESIRSRVRFAALDILREAGSWSQGTLTPGSPSAAAFLSYSRQDADAVRRIKSGLEDHGIQVHIDDTDMRPGEDIEQFIRRSVSDSDAVISVVSSDSLLSPWCGLENALTLYSEMLSHEDKLIATYLDETFLDVNFRLAATDRIDAKLEEIEKLLAQYAQRKIDGSDLQRQQSRLFELRNNLGKILDRLRNTLCLDVRDAAWANTLPRLVAAIEQIHRGQVE